MTPCIVKAYGVDIRRSISAPLGIAVALGIGGIGALLIDKQRRAAQRYDQWLAELDTTADEN
jgi:hypothetical protein